MAYLPHLLIDQETGEFDWTYIQRHALLRAQADFGAQEVPVSWVRDQIRALKAIAFVMRERWLEARGLRDDTVMVQGFQIVDPFYKRNMWDSRAGQWVAL